MDCICRLQRENDVVKRLVIGRQNEFFIVASVNKIKRSMKNAINGPKKYISTDSIEKKERKEKKTVSIRLGKHSEVDIERLNRIL